MGMGAGVGAVGFGVQAQVLVGGVVTTFTQKTALGRSQGRFYELTAEV
jgi:hypothetical protein